MKGRVDRIRAGLDWAEKKGIIRSWYGQTGMPGRRWVVGGVGFSTRVWNTHEVEAFLLGASEGRTSALLESK